jgi:hypothetical protein
MKKNCVNCHFLAEKILLKDNKSITDSIGLNLRNTIKEQKIKPSATSDGVMVCHQGVWDEGIAPHNNFYNSCVAENRNNCFFYPYQENMLFRAAKELQKRVQENKELKRSNMYTRIGLWVTSGALLLSALVSWFKVA